MVSISRICNEQQSTFGNKNVHIHGKLRRELRMEETQKKGKVEKAMEFVERMRKIQKEAGVALKKVQEDIKR